MRPVSQPGQLLGQIPTHPPMHRRPMHSTAGGYLHHVRPGQHRTNRVQPLLNNRQDNQRQSRPPRVPTPRGDVGPRVPKRTTVADHLADACRTSADGGHALPRCVADFPCSGSRRRASRDAGGEPAGGKPPRPPAAPGRRATDCRRIAAPKSTDPDAPTTARRHGSRQVNLIEGEGFRLPRQSNPGTGLPPGYLRSQLRPRQPEPVLQLRSRWASLPEHGRLQPSEEP